MLVAAALVPEAPLLLPGATGNAIAEVEQVRSSARAAVHWLIARGLDAVVAVAGAEIERAWSARTPAGVQRHTGAADSAGEVLPLGLAVLTTLVAGAASPALQSVARSAGPAHAAALGEHLAAGASRVGLVVAGDGSARRGPKAPGYLDDRAAGLDAAVERAFRSGDLTALLTLDPDLAAELLVSGRAAWQVLAGAAEGRRADVQLDHCADPFGVMYFVARCEL